jgi:hypothetical protein
MLQSSQARHLLNLVSPLANESKRAYDSATKETVRNRSKEREVETYKVEALQPSALSDLRARPSTILVSVCMVLPRLSE